MDIVNFNFFGGDSAKKLKDAIETRHRTLLHSVEDLLAENEKKQSELDQIERNLSSDTGSKTRNKIQLPEPGDIDEEFRDLDTK